MVNSKLSVLLTASALSVLTWNAASANGQEGLQNIDIVACNNNTNLGGNPVPYAAKPGDTVNESIPVLNNSGNVTWSVASFIHQCTVSGTTSAVCGKYTVTAPDGAVDNTHPVTVTGSGFTNADIGFSNDFTLTVTDATPNTCKIRYELQVTSDSGGWGDPHLTTVDGVAYDFQGAGEYTLLRQKELEIQARQAPVPTTTTPVLSAHTGLASCVSYYTAFAARIGKNDVSYEPSSERGTTTSVMQLRVNHDVVTIPAAGIDLYGGDEGDGGGEGSPSAASAAGSKHLVGHIANVPGNEGSIEISNSHGTRIDVVPSPWPDQHSWLLTINAYNTTAVEGLWGRTIDGWLPAKSDGTSVGAKGTTTADVYNQVYGQLGESWRVTKDTSLFDYAEGTSTDTFTNKAWPGSGDCKIEGQQPLPPATVQVAEQACSAVVDPTHRNDCIFDVTWTGFTGFGQNYSTAEHVQRGAVTVTVTDDKNPTQQGEPATFHVTVAEAAPRNQGTPTGTLQLTVDGSPSGSAVTVDSTGKGTITTPDLPVGTHQVVVKFTPAKDVVFVSGASLVTTHTVTGSTGLPWWVIILLVILLILIILWLMKSKKP
jgi:hypothetical protein